VTTKLRLLPGSYTDLEGLDSEYYPYVNHFVKRSNKSFICSKQYKITDGDLTAVGGKCLGCEAIEKGDDGVGWQLLHAFNAIHLAYYHLEPVFDDDGKPIVYKKGDRQGEQVHRKVLCEGRRCKYCKDGLEKVFGKKVHLSLGSRHLGQLAGITNEIEKDCANCGGRLEEVLWECSNCAEPLIDLANTDMKDEDILKVTARHMECPKCGTKDFPIKQSECDGCQDPTPLSIFDCDLEIKREGENTDSTIMVPRWTPTELSDDLKEMAKPWPFKKVFSPDPFDWQAKVLKIRNPYGSEGQDKARDYAEEPEL
jgi:hypothetical protein